MLVLPTPSSPITSTLKRCSRHSATGPSPPAIPAACLASARLCSAPKLSRPGSRLQATLPAGPARAGRQRGGLNHLTAVTGRGNSALINARGGKGRAAGRSGRDGPRGAAARPGRGSGGGGWGRGAIAPSVPVPVPARGPSVPLPNWSRFVSSSVWLRFFYEPHQAKQYMGTHGPEVSSKWSVLQSAWCHVCRLLLLGKISSNNKINKITNKTKSRLW